MTLHPPFFISSHLAPALKIGDATLSLLNLEGGYRDRATFCLEIPGMPEYEDRQLQSGIFGFRSTVEVFETLLGFLQACGEGFQYQTRTGRESDNATLFPPHIAEWAAENLGAVEMARLLICNEDGEDPNDGLIEE